MENRTKQPSEHVEGRIKDSAQNLPNCCVFIQRAKQEVEMAKEKSKTRDSNWLRGIIFEELEALRSGDSNPTKANAVAKLAASAVDTVRLDIEVSEHLNRAANNAKVVSGDALNPVMLAAE